MSAIKPKIDKGIKYWNIVDDPKLTFTDAKGVTWKGKQAFNRKFESILLKLKASEEARLGRPLKSPEISALRRHKNIGVWLIDGVPASVKSVNAFVDSVKSGGKRKTLSLNVPKRLNKYFTREFIESAEFRDAQLGRWYKRLDKQGWPEGTSRKGFITYLSNAYDRVDEYNKILAKRLGFPFQAGHLWGAMGPIDDRTTIGPYGNLSGGKFTPRNVTSQPATASLAHLLSKWGIITPNVPSRFDPRGVQVEGAQSLLDVGAGGQGWPGAFVDYLLDNNPNIDQDFLTQLDPYDKAYVAFGDPSKGDFIGKTAEARLAQLLEPGGRDRVLKGARDFAATAEDFMPKDIKGRLINQARNIARGSKEWWDLQLQMNKLPNSRSGYMAAAAPVLAFGANFLDLAKPGTITSRRLNEQFFDDDPETNPGLVGKGSIWESYRGDLVSLGKVAAGMRVGMPIANWATRGVAGKVAGTAFSGPVGWTLLAGGLASTADDIFFGGEIKNTIKETAKDLAVPIAEGAELTSIPSDFDYKSRKLGSINRFPFQDI